MKTKREHELTIRIRSICAGKEPGDVLCSLLHITIEKMRTLDETTREEVVMEYIKTLVYPDEVRKMVVNQTDDIEPAHTRNQADDVALDFEYPRDWWRKREYSEVDPDRETAGAVF
jgi:hypothetical protein